MDRAHAQRLAGKPEEALRLAASLLAAEPGELGAAQLCARLLFEGGRIAVAADTARECARRRVEQGDLPGACVAALLVRQCVGDSSDVGMQIAEAFAKGSPRVDRNASMRPPPLPREVEVAPFFAQASGQALLDAAEKAVARFLGQAAPPPAKALPQLPLFGALPAAPLARLLSRFQLREFAKGDFVVREGETGAEAFVLVRGVLNALRAESGGTHQLLAVLGPGAVFGEMALVSSAPRAGSVVAVEAAQVLVVGRDALEELAAQEPALAAELSEFCHQRMIANLLRHSAILSAVDPSERGALIARFATEQVAAGTVLMRSGEEPSRLYLIASGGVQVRGRDADGDTVVLAELGPGEVVGEISLVLRRPAGADVVAIHPSVLLSLTRERFHEVIREHPTLLRDLYEVAVSRDEETRTIVAQKAEDVSDIVLL